MILLPFFQLDTVELWEAQSKNPGPLKYHVSRGSTAFAEELEAQDLVFRTDRGRITEILAHPEEPPHVLNIKRGILSALQVQFVNEHAVLEEVRDFFAPLLGGGGGGECMGRVLTPLGPSVAQR